MWQGVKEDVRDSIWIGRPVYDKFGRKGEIISDMWGALDDSTQFNYRVWVIRLDAGGTIQVENAVNFGVPQPFDESGILYFDGDNWVALSEHPDTAYGISLKQAEFPNVSGHPDYQAVLKDDSWLRQPVVKPPFEPVKEGKISMKDLLDMARRNTKIFGDLSNKPVACLEPIHEWLDKNYDEYMSGSTKRLQELKDNGEIGYVQELEAYIEARQTAYDHNKHLLKEHSVLACDMFQAFLDSVADEFANPENYDRWCREGWPKRHLLTQMSRGVAPPPCPSVPEFLGYYVANEGINEVVHNWFEYGAADFIEEYIMNQYQIPAEQQDLDVDMGFHDERSECYDLLRLIEEYCEYNLEEIVFEAYYGDEASDMLKVYRNQHYEAETFHADQFGTSSLEGFAYYDRLPDLGNPKTINSDVSNIAAPFVAVFDKKGIRTIANVGIKENQNQIAPQMMLARSKSDTNYFFIYLRPNQTKKAESMWQQTQYCELYDYLKEIALTEEGAFGGLQGDKATLENTEKWFQDRNIRSIEALMSIHCEDEDDEQPSPLGLFNWFKRFSAETFAASRRKRKPLNQTGVFNWWDETALWALKYDWVKLILLENPEKSPYEVMRTTRNDTRKCPSCANRRSRRGGRENYGAMVEHYNNGLKRFTYDLCRHDFWDSSGEKRRQKEVKKEMLRRGLVADMDKVHPDIQPAAAKWYLKKGKRDSKIPYYFHREYSHPTFFQRLRKRFTRRRGYSDWWTQEREKYMSENFSAPFMDITFQDTPMQVKQLYHGQHTVDGAEITPHSPYWTTDLGLALGHALFGAEQEVTGADLLICALCDGTHTTAKGDMCYSCDEDGYVLQETFTDEILPQTTPLVLSLDFTEPQTVYFTQDMEHDEGVSYLVQNESFNWNFVPADTLLALLYTWLDTGLPELVEFDTGAGYVEHESSVTKRIKQAIQQLEQSAG